MDYTLPSYIAEYLTTTGEDPEAFLNRAVSAAVLKDKMDGWSELPYYAILDVFCDQISGMLLLTFADGDRKLFDTALLKNSLFKDLTYPVNASCAVKEGYTVAFEDKHGIFSELPPQYLYENSVSITCLKPAVQQAAAKERVKRSEEHLYSRSSAPSVSESLDDLHLPADFVNDFEN